MRKEIPIPPRPKEKTMKISKYCISFIFMISTLLSFPSFNVYAEGLIKDKLRDIVRGIFKKNSSKDESKISNSAYEKIRVSKESARMGVFDPSLEYERNGKTGWMVYTAIDFPNMFTHLAKTEDNGKTWKFITAVNSPSPDTQTIKNKKAEGLWRNEVATLVHDPDDPGKEWKLFSHKYFIKSPYIDYKQGKPFKYMYIEYKYAHKPEDLSSARGIILFSTGRNPNASMKAKYNLNQLHPDLSRTLIYTEPGSLYKDGTLYLSMSAASTKRNDNKIFLLSSGDHGNTWKYVGTLIDYKDADNFDVVFLTASSLVKKAERYFLFAAPVSKKGAHEGTYILEFEDISKARLRRDTHGKLVVIKYLRPSIKTKNAGESDYDEHNTYGGIIMPQEDQSRITRGVDPRTVESFKIFSTKEKILD